VSARGDTACVAEWYYGLEVIDVRDPAHPVVASHYDEANHSLYVSAADGLAFVSGYRPGVQVLDVSDPSNTRRITEWGDVFTFRTRVRGSIAYLAEADRGISALDISNPADPQRIATLAVPEQPVDFILDGDYAYVVSNSASLTIADVSDPSNMRQVSNVPIDSAIGLAKSGHLVFVAAYETLQILDVSNPAAPQFLGEIATPHLSWAVAVVDDVAFVATLGGVLVIDAADPTSPQIVTSLPGGGSQWQSIEAVGNRVYLAAYPGLRVFDATDPRQPRLSGTYHDQGWEHGLTVAGGLTFLATAEGGLEIIAVRPPGDLDGDNDIDLFDLTALLASFGVCEGNPSFNAYADLDSDGCVDLSDLTALLTRFGS
jgi:hypothetical protein